MSRNTIIVLIYVPSSQMFRSYEKLRCFFHKDLDTERAKQRTVNIITCKVVSVTKIMGSSSDDCIY
jgi:hypothetical protein